MIDSHCHLDQEPLFSNLENVLNRSKLAGITKILTICTTFNSYINIKKIINSHDMVYGTYGIHPHESKTNKVNIDQIIKEIKNEKKIIGIGETGLDFFYNHSDKDEQIDSFEKHIAASIKMNIPLIIHSRNAEKEMFEILDNYKNFNLKILMHCFTGSNELVKKLLKFNTFFSASGIITFKKSIELQDTFKSIPLDNLLIETDSPYLAPEPNRGKKNEPSFIQYTSKKLAEIKSISNEELISITTSNFNRLFNF